MKTRAFQTAFFALTLSAIGAFATVAQQSAPPPPPPPPPAAKSAPSKAPSKPLQIGGEVMSAKRIDHTVPVYPADAKSANVSGKVVLQVIVSKSGEVTEEKVISTDNSLLTQSALDAVKKFRYAPTLLSGEPISVLTTVTVTYELDPKPKSK
jgi:periplasmic protein TonB